METLWDLELELDGLHDLARVAGLLARAGINVDSICCTSALNQHGHRVVCHLLVGDGPSASTALAESGVSAAARQVVVCVLQNRPGTLAAVSAALHDAQVTVDLLYQATERGLVIAAGDLAAVRAAVIASGRLAAESLVVDSRR